MLLNICSCSLQTGTGPSLSAATAAPPLLLLEKKDNDDEDVVYNHVKMCPSVSPASQRQCPQTTYVHPATEPNPPIGHKAFLPWMLLGPESALRTQKGYRALFLKTEALGPSLSLLEVLVPRL